MILLTVVMPTALFVVIILFTIGSSFFGGCVWMASGKVNKEAEEAAARATHKVIDLDESLRDSSRYAWRPEKQN